MGRMIRKKKHKNDKVKVIPISEMELTAFHEAGHAVVDLIVGIPFESVRLSEKDSGESGATETNGFIAPHYQAVMSLFSGLIAEDIRHGRQPKLRDSQTSLRDNKAALKAAIEYCLSADEAVKFMEWCHARASNLLRFNWGKVERLAERLLKDKRISYEEAKATFSESVMDPPEAQGSTIGNG